MQYEFIQGTEQDRLYLEEKIDNFNNTHLKNSTIDKHLDFMVSHNNIIVGGITCIIYWDCLFIDLLWLEEKYRNKGIGSQLLSKAEDSAKILGIQMAHLNTFDFQAKEFYIRNGYSIFGVLEDCPLGHKRFFLTIKL